MSAFLLVAVSLRGEAQAAGSPSNEKSALNWEGGEVLPDKAELRRYRLEIADLVDRSDFEGLEALIAGERASGRWTLEAKPAESAFHEIITDYRFFKSRDVEARNLRFLNGWRAAYPASSAPPSLLARLHVMRAWRGEEQWDESLDEKTKDEVFYDHLLQGHRALEEALEAGVVPDVETFRIWLDIARGLHAEDLVRQAILAAGREKRPDYLPLYRGYMLSLFPRWFGSFEVYANFCDRMYRSLGGEDGEILYARLCGYILESNSPGEFLNGAPFNRARIHGGYRRCFERFPHSVRIASEYHQLSRLLGNVDGQNWIFEEVARVAGVDLDLNDRRALWKRWRRDPDAALRPAIKAGDGALVVVLLRLGADPFEEDLEGRTARDFAREQGQDRIRRLLQEAESALSFPAHPGIKTLVRAVRRGRLDLVRRFIEEGADVHAEPEGMPLVVEAVYEEDPDILEAFLEAGADPNAETEDWTPLTLATDRGQLDHVRLLLKHGADPNFRNGTGRAPLHNAAERGHVEALELLLDAGADLTLTFAGRRQAWTPLGMAVYRGEIEATDRLIEHGSDVHEAMSGETYLAIAARRNHPELVRYLLEQGVNPAIGWPEQGLSPLHMAARYGATDAMEVLIEEGGAAINVTDEMGNTPLHAASYYGQIESVEVLLKHEANRSIRNSYDLTPYEAAQAEGHVEIERLLGRQGEPLIVLPPEAQAGYPEENP